MNLILLESTDIDGVFARSDRRYRHLHKVLKASPGDCFKAGILNGPVGSLLIESTSPEAIHYRFTPRHPAPPLYPLTLICGLPRPQQAKRILRDCTSMGVSGLEFFPTESGEKSYLHSPVWHPDAVHALMVEGLEQSGGTRLPQLLHRNSLQECLDARSPSEALFVLHNDHDAISLSRKLQDTGANRHICLLIGSERGWTVNELSVLRKAQLPFAVLGNRILRTDTACIAAAGIVISN